MARSKRGAGNDASRRRKRPKRETHLSSTAISRNSPDPNTHTTGDATHESTTEASRNAVLNTYELLESILVCLPPKDLFVLQRVSKQWRNSIARSQQIQKAMFLRLEGVPRNTWKAEIDRTVAPISVKVTRICGHDQLVPVTKSSDVSSVTPVTLGPALRKYCRVTRHLELASGGTVTSDHLHHLKALSAKRQPRRISAFDTYISSPPCYNFTVRLAYKFTPKIPQFGCLSGTVAVRTDTALRLGELIQRALAVPTTVYLGTVMKDNAPHKTFHDVPVIEVIRRLQLEHRCTAGL